MQYIVTIKVPNDKDHDPKNKQTGNCIVSSKCTDKTGAHHSYLVEAPSIDEIKGKLVNKHITRIEKVEGRLVL